MRQLALVCVGGAIGSGARYLVGLWALQLLGAAFPFGTLAVNVVGSFLIGVILHPGLAPSTLSPDIRLFLATGVMGGFTTYSSFNQETLVYLRDGAWGAAALYFAATVMLCLAAGLLGAAAARCSFGG